MSYSDLEQRFFIPCDNFTGAKAGYVFKTDFKGLGYYLDSNAGDAKKRPLNASGETYSENKKIKMGSDTLAVIKEFVSINEKTLRRSLTKLVKWHKINEAEYIKYQTMKDNVRLKHICDKVAKQLGESETKLNVILNDILPVTAYPIFFNILGESVNMNAVLTLLLHESRSISFVVTDCCME